MSDARTTLEVVLKATGFDTGAASIKKLGDEATTANAKLKTTATTVDQAAKSSATLGSKLKNAGSQFAGTITSVAALGSTVVNLSRQYQDLGDTQIAVEKAQRKVSVAHEAVAKATAALNSALAKYGKGSKQAQQAALDLNQAQSQLSISTQLLTERTEDHQRAQENFWMGVVPTILTAGTSMTSMFKEMGGTSGIGGLTSKLKELPASLGMSTKAFVGMAGAIGLASVAMVELISQLQRGSQIKALQIFNEGPGRTSGSIQSEIAALKAQKASWGQQLKDFLTPRFGTDSGATIIDEVVKSLESKESRDKLIVGLQTTLTAVMNTPMDPSVKAGVVTQIKTIMAMLANDANWNAGYGASAEAVSKNTKKVITDGLKKAIDSISSAPPLGLTGALKTMYDKVLGYPGTTLTGETAKFALNPALLGIPSDTTLNKLYADFKVKLEAKTRSLFDKQPALDEDWFLGSWAETSADFDKGFQDMAKASDDAARKIKEDQVAAAAETQAAWDKAFNAQTSGIDKIFAAYHKLHPGSTIEGKKGTTTLAPGQLPIDIANKAFEALESGLAQKISSPASAKTYVTNWIATAAGHMKGVAGQLLAPITEYINAHKSEAPETFMSGFIQFLSGFNLTDTFSKAFLPVVTVAKDTGTTAAKGISTGLAKVDVTPLEEKMKLGAEAAGLVTKGINKIPKKVTSTINITANLAQANAKWQAFARKVQGTTLQVKIAGTSVNIRKGSQAGAYGGPHAAGWNTTVKRPTMFMAGEGGRPEDVYIKPKGSAGQGPSGSGFNGTINVYVDGVLRPARYDMGARK